MKKLRYGQMLLALPLLMLSSLALAEPGRSTEQSVDNGLPQVPIVGFITQRFLFTGHFQVKLTRSEMRIDHMAANSSCPMPKRNCHISLAYSTPIMGQMGAGLFELPVLGAEHVNSHWTTASFGDYIAHFSDTPTYTRDVRVMATLKF